MTLKTIQINKININQIVKMLIDIDKEYSSLDSGIYSREIWNIGNFTIDLPGKWENSWGIMSEDDLCAFAICSKKDRRTLHIHRLAVHKDYKGSSASDLLMFAILGGGVQADKITLMVSTENVRAVRYYFRHGFDIISGDTLNAFIEEREIHVCHIGDDFFVDNSRFHDSHYVMEKKMGDRNEEKSDHVRRFRLSGDCS